MIEAVRAAGCAKLHLRNNDIDSWKSSESALETTGQS